MNRTLVHKDMDMDRDGISVYVAKVMDKDGFKNLTNTDPSSVICVSASSKFFPISH